jgi:N-acetylmuramate 1-kinase
MNHAKRLEELLPIVSDFLLREWNATLTAPVEAIPGQASNRRYYRIRLTGKAPPQMILVQLPPDPFESDEASHGLGRRELPFCSMLRFLKEHDLPVPRLFADRTAEGFLLQEDLGKTTLFAELQMVPESRFTALYEEAIALLVDFQKATVEPPSKGPACVGFDRRFTPALLRWELDHFKEWLLIDHCEAALSKSDDGGLEKAFDKVAAELADTPYRLAHRDYQSTNLMRHEGRLVLIDFQDALMAPPLYDLVALLRDSYVALSQNTVDHLLSCYWQQAAKLLPFSCESAMRQHFHLQTVQRKLKDAGRFIFIDRVKGNPGFLQWVEPTLGYVREALPQITGGLALQELLGRHVPTLAASERR